MTRTDYRQAKHTFPDGAWSVVHTAKFGADRLKFEDLHPMSSYVRQQDIARMLYARAQARGENSPQILTWTAMQTDRRASQVFPDVSHRADDGEEVISANSFITCALRKMLAEGWLQLHEYLGDTYEWQAHVPPGQAEWTRKAEAVLRWLEDEIQLDLYPNVGRGTYQPRVFNSFDLRHNFARIGRCDFVRHFVQNHDRAAVFNTSHFLHEPDDLISHHSGYGDAVGLLVAENTMLRPPIYRRGALLYADGRWRIETVGMEDIALILPGEIRLQPGTEASLNPSQPQPITIFTRAGALNSKENALQRSPSAPEHIEFVIVNRQVLSWKRGGGLPIPQNGFVLSLQDGALPNRVIDDIIGDAWIEYAFAEEREPIQSAIQAGPILLRNGESVETNEEFRASHSGSVGISPVRMDSSAADSRKARSAIGINADGSLTLLVVDGCDPASRTPLDSAGVTLAEICEMLRAAGVVDALNLSGEGSSHLFVAGGLANAPSDRRGQPGVVYERMLPSIGIVL